MRDSAARVQALELQAAAHSTKLASMLGNVTHFEKSFEIHQRLVANSQSALLSLEGERNK